MVLTELLSLHFVRSNEKQWHQVGLAVPQPQNCSGQEGTCEFCSCPSKQGSLSHHAQESQWENKLTTTGFPTLPITPFLPFQKLWAPQHPGFVYTMSTPLCMQATLNSILCFHGNGRGCISNPPVWAILTPASAALNPGWEQQSTDVNSNHGAHSWAPLCPLCSTMHPSRVTITVIQLVLLKKTKPKPHEGPCQYLFLEGRLVWVNKITIRTPGFTIALWASLLPVQGNDLKPWGEGKEICSSSTASLIKATEQLS